MKSACPVQNTPWLVDFGPVEDDGPAFVDTTDTADEGGGCDAPAGRDHSWIVRPENSHPRSPENSHPCSTTERTPLPIDLSFEPFEISILSEAGGKYWAMKYIQGSKPINDEDAIKLLEQEFLNNKSDTSFNFENNYVTENEDEEYVEITIEDEKELM